LIKEYSFGSIQINNKVYRSDLLIYTNGQVEDSWWRDEGHCLSLNDITKLVADQPEIIVAGTGASGLMKIEKGLTKALSDKGIRLLVMPSQEAMNTYNKLKKQHRVAACFHLTC